MIKEAVDKYLEHEVWFRQEVQKGLDALAAGDVRTHEEVKERMRGLGVHDDVTTSGTCVLIRTYFNL